MPESTRGKPQLIPERLVANLWRNRDCRRPLRLQDGRWLRVLYPGRPGGGPGPDFRDAVVQMEGSPPIRGDVEVHRQAAGWTQHGHHRDQRYNNVVLHVVNRSSGGVPNYRQDGWALPVTELPVEVPPLPDTPPNLTENGMANATLPQLRSWRNLSQEQMGSLLDRAGERRFRLKSTRYREQLDHADVEGLLYLGILEALGYSRNRKPFMELARRLPWHTLQDAVGSVPPAYREPAARHMMMRVAGLSRRTPIPPEEAGFPPGSGWLGHASPMDASAWCFASIRPGNQPAVRIAGAAGLVGRYLDTGLLGGLVPLARGKSMAALSSALTVVDGRTTLIGRGRALDISVNVVLPLFHAWSLHKRDPALTGSCLRLFRAAPRLAENEITREMAFLLSGSSKHTPAGGAQRQQGLIHLYEVLLKDRR